MDFRKRSRSDAGANVNGDVKKYKPGENFYYFYMVVVIFLCVYVLAVELLCLIE